MADRWGAPNFEDVENPDRPADPPADRTALDARSLSADALRHLFEVLPYGVILFDATLSIREANPAALRILGMSERQFDRPVGSPDWHFTDRDGRRLAFQELPLSQAFASGKPVRNFTVGAFNSVTGKKIWLRGDVLPDATGRQIQYWSIFRDATPEVEMEMSQPA